MHRNMKFRWKGWGSSCIFIHKIQGLNFSALHLFYNAAFLISCLCGVSGCEEGGAPPPCPASCRCAEEPVVCIGDEDETKLYD